MQMRAGARHRRRRRMNAVRRRSRGRRRRRGVVGVQVGVIDTVERRRRRRRRGELARRSHAQRASHVRRQPTPPPPRRACVPNRVRRPTRTQRQRVTTLSGECDNRTERRIASVYVRRPVYPCRCASSSPTRSVPSNSFVQ